MLELLDLVTPAPRLRRAGCRASSPAARSSASASPAPSPARREVVVADEPVSALDVSVQAAVTELLIDIQRDSRTTMLFISHDLGIVRYLADRVMVMYLGHVVEIGTTDQVFEPPYHPYTEALLSAVPIADTSVVKEHIVLEGDIPSALNPPPGCPFQTRCPRKRQVPGDLCETEVPPMRRARPRPPGQLPPVARGLRRDAAGDPRRRRRRDRARSGAARAVRPESSPWPPCERRRIFAGFTDFYRRRDVACA